MFYRYPFVKQEDFKECGVCCLSMMIEYYQGHYSKSELLKLTHTTQKGTSAYHLLEASRKIGFQAKGVKCTTDLSKLQSEDIILRFNLLKKFSFVKFKSFSNAKTISVFGNDLFPLNQYE